LQFATHKKIDNKKLTTKLHYYKGGPQRIY